VITAVPAPSLVTLCCAFCVIPPLIVSVRPGPTFQFASLQIEYSVLMVRFFAAEDMSMPPSDVTAFMISGWS